MCVVVVVEKRWWLVLERQGCSRGCGVGVLGVVRVVLVVEKQWWLVLER